MVVDLQYKYSSEPERANSENPFDTRGLYKIIQHCKGLLRWQFDIDRVTAALRPMFFIVVGFNVRIELQL